MNRKLTVSLAGLLLAVAAGAQTPLKDRPGFKDPNLFTRMPGYFLSHPNAVKDVQYDAYQFWVRQGNKDAKQSIEGHLLTYYYIFDKSTGQPPATGLQIKRNYQNAAQKLGAKILFDNDPTYYKTTLLITRDGQEKWVEVSTIAASYTVTIVERKAMQQDVGANAEALKSGLAEAGHAEVSGIFFDFNKADLKPESKPAMDQVVKLLQANPAMRVWVVGHTDNVGTAESNVTLSNARATAVVKGLVQAGIDPKRLTPHGNGPYAPVAANTTDDGRAKNRRVELVAQP